MRAVAGLGNPGSEYTGTRHNAGWMLLDRLRDKGKVLERREKEWAELEKLKLGPDTVWLIRSKTYMNGSGLGVAQACKSLQIEPRELLVTYDDVDLPLGAIRIRPGGGSGGHRGLESVIESLATKSVARMRLGVKGATRRRDTAGYVLDGFESDEIETLDDMLDRGVAAIRMIMRRGIQPAMNTYNTTPKPTAQDAEATPTQEQSE